jgi:tRNA/rRNA methyltransferase
MISVVLIESETSGNVGSIARAMKNFGLKKLVLVNPKCDHLNMDATSRAKHAKAILTKAVVLKKFSQLKRFDLTIATTAAIGTDYNVARLPITPEKLADNIKGKGNIALILGREGTGLRNTEIMQCDFVVSIPASVKYRALNISHAAVIIFYELFKKSKAKKIGHNFVLASSSEKDVIMNIIESILKRMPFHFDSQRVTQKKIWKRLIGKAMLSRRESFAVIGFFKKMYKLKQEK